MSNQGAGFHFLLSGMLTKQEETETNMVKLTFGAEPARSESSQGCLWPPARRSQREQQQQGLTRAGLLALLGSSLRRTVKLEKIEVSLIKGALSLQQTPGSSLRFQKYEASTAVLLSLQLTLKNAEKDYRGLGSSIPSADHSERHQSVPGVHTRHFFEIGLAPWSISQAPRLGPHDFKWLVQDNQLYGVQKSSL